MVTGNHIAWLNETTEVITTKDGRAVKVWELVCDYTDAVTWSAWAKHFREHYCLDEQIDDMRAGTPHSRSEYMRALVFPDNKAKPGPSIRAGDFGEILISDLLEFGLGFWVPRGRYAEKAVRNESPKGTDIIGIRFENADGVTSVSDILITCEAKAQFTGKTAKPRLQHAVDDAVKDHLRLAETLNAAKRRLFDRGARDEGLKIQRFQSPLDNPYVRKHAAAALFTAEAFDPDVIAATDCQVFGDSDDLLLITVKAGDFMSIVTALYERAADEA